MRSSVSLILLCKQAEGTVVTCNTRYGKSGMKDSLRVATAKGYYRKVRNGAFVRTAKPLVPGDSLSKPINYSYPDEQQERPAA